MVRELRSEPVTPVMLGTKLTAADEAEALGACDNNGEELGDGESLAVGLVIGLTLGFPEIGVAVPVVLVEDVRSPTVNSIIAAAAPKSTIPIKTPTMIPNFISNYLIVTETEKKVSQSILSLKSPMEQIQYSLAQIYDDQVFGKFANPDRWQELGDRHLCHTRNESSNLKRKNRLK